LNLKNNIPWWGKIIIKMILSKINVSYHLWKKLKLFQHGDMCKPDYAYSVFIKHFENSKFHRKSSGFVSMELGPGDSLYSALIAYCFGAKKSYLIDTGQYAIDDPTSYMKMVDYLVAKGFTVPNIDGVSILKNVLDVYNAKYETDGLASLKCIADNSVDFIWSQAVLEHIRRAEFREVIRETRRVLRDDGVCSHQIDLKDHLSFSLNNLRFSDETWESDLMANSGFYTNRLRYNEIIRIFEEEGFNVEINNINRWDKLPISKDHLNEKYAVMSDDELLISGFDVILSPK
jgi:SAM-dependent methyltransferase